MQERLLLKMNPERAVLPTAKLDMFGKRVAAHLKANQTNWQLYNLATLFWRAKGEPVKAVNCIRQALLRSPSSYKHVTLLHLGNVFHQSKRSVEAAIILHAAIDHSSDEPESHWTLGNIYSVLGDYQRAIMCYKNALRLDKSLPIVEKNLLAVECHVSVNQALSEVMERLQELLSDLEDAKLLKQQRSRIESLVHKYKSITNIAERNFGTEVGNRIMDLDDRLKSLVDMVKTLSENMDFEKRVLTKLNPQEGECLFLEEIDAAVLYSSFEHRISDILNEGLNLKKGENHPLPWHPPMCEEDFRRKFPQIPNNVMNNFLSPGKSNKLKAQPSLMKHLREFVDAELEADEELGQRIHAALEKVVFFYFLSYFGLQKIHISRLIHRHHLVSIKVGRYRATIENYLIQFAIIGLCYSENSKFLLSLQRLTSFSWHISIPLVEICPTACLWKLIAVK
ncbi:Hypothetical predicted protein [Cloeon dipterum]|nr:Hypothetical predicted protein [Cloeon dipterum]